METSGAIPAPTVTASELQDLVGARGPFATLYLTTEAAVENAAQRTQQRWKTARSDLQVQGAPAAVLDLIEPLVDTAHEHGECLAVIATADRVLHVEHLPEPPKRDLARWSALPVYGPLIEWHQQAVPHLVVLVDRRGADLLAFQRVGPDFVREIEGDDDPLTKSKPGGWSQRRYQRRAENTWEHNAKEVATAVTELVAEIDARLVVVAGDVRAVQLLQDDLDRDVHALVRVVDGGRVADGSTDDIAEEATRLVATVAASETRVLLEKFREERGQQDRAADGPVETISALNEARVAVLLVPGDADLYETAWFGAEAIPVALSAETMAEMGVERPEHAPLLDVLVHAALGSGAGVRIIPRAAAPERGIGAILRW